MQRGVSEVWAERLYHDALRDEKSKSKAGLFVKRGFWGVSVGCFFL